MLLDKDYTNSNKHYCSKHLHCGGLNSFKYCRKVQDVVDIVYGCFHSRFMQQLQFIRIFDSLQLAAIRLVYVYMVVKKGNVLFCVLGFEKDDVLHFCFTLCVSRWVDGSVGVVTFCLCCMSVHVCRLDGLSEFWSKE